MPVKLRLSLGTLCCEFDYVASLPGKSPPSDSDHLIPISANISIKKVVVKSV